MSKLITRFPFTYITKGYLGLIWRPYALCEFKVLNEDTWIPIEMVIDTGADYTLLPKNYSSLLGINVNKDCFREASLGIGGSKTVYLHKGLLIKLGNWKRKVPVGFLDQENIPPLLGRLNFFELLNITFSKRITIFKN
ncbi:MAG: retroviral-like aspartic protease family protein [Candidatus Melainabacteria bacterium]|nr:retroviral-like aspartic protease family protein [Candidatus Melainabacteria bacterium]